ncbi:WS/DGAT/MGAT family O-acyltransferase [Hahella ganghwensis]|uniref:WS/DGAT/MGAT family O-acyltransferase n=1 Tax=Hahella ganghwensis TaxID=286420 RepID=UPI00036ED310|nr:wax ester/triacylglycerol synthase family O-acyltransferase [Hahella ganghwensis]
MQQLSELDTSFLYLESESSPMHIGGIYVLNCQDRGQPLTYDDLYNHIESRLPASRRFRQRLVEVPLKLDHPYWVDDPDFSLSHHLDQVTLDKGKNQSSKLFELAASIISTPLDRERPLWHITLIEGLEDSKEFPGACCALVVKIHHSAVDGVTGEELVGTLLDFTADGERKFQPVDWDPQPLPSKARLISNAYGSALNTPFRLANLAKDAAASAFYTLLVQRLRKLALPPSLFSAPYTEINQPIDSSRSVAFFECSLNQLKQIKKSHSDLTLNDVVVTLCSEVLSNYLSEVCLALPDTPLIAMQPISVRSKHIDSPTGSQLSALLISLATDEPNLAIRMQRIHENASASHVYSQAISATRLTQLVPSAMLGLSARIYTEFQLAQKHKPLFNVPITNIPGPQYPLYFNGARVDYQLGTAPLFDGLGLVFVISSYAGKVTFTLTACPGVVPDLQPLINHFPKAIEKLKLDVANTSQATLEAVKDNPDEQTVFSGLVGDIVSLFSNLFTGNGKTEAPEETK